MNERLVFVLVSTMVNEEMQVIDTLKALSGYIELEPLIGAYDVIAKLSTTMDVKDIYKILKDVNGVLDVKVLTAK